MILVTGATGTVGREVVTQLLASGKKVRAMTRNPAKARLDQRAELVRGDFEAPESLERAVNGAEKIFLLRLDRSRERMKATLLPRRKRPAFGKS